MQVSQISSQIVAVSKRYWKDAYCVLAFLVLCVGYFATPLSEGLVLSGHDTMASIGQGHENQTYYEQTGETSRWTNSMFSGMPTYQISPSYGSTSALSTVNRVLSLRWLFDNGFFNDATSGAIGLVFLYMLGFFIMLRSYGCRSWLSALGAVAWAFSSYFFIIIAAGHIWKVMALGFIPPTIGGLFLCYRGKLVKGGVVTALFTALQVYANHLQMTYYFLFVMGLIVVCYGVSAAIRQWKPAFVSNTLTLKNWAKATVVIAIAGILGVFANLPNIYHTYAYAKESLRGKSELTTTSAAKQGSDGLSAEYITQWSYGIDETMTLLIPDYKGGGDGESILDTDAAQDNDTFIPTLQALAQAFQTNNLPGTRCYWGNQPFTVGPVYVGALICFLFILGLFIVRGPVKWALALATVVSLLFAWGHNIMPFTEWLIAHLPMYSKFRTVSSALVIAEFTMPMLAILALLRIVGDRNWLASRYGKISLGVSLALTAGVCLLFWLFPSLAGNCIGYQEGKILAQMAEQIAPYEGQIGISMQAFIESITDVRHGVLAASARRSFFIILIGVALILLYHRYRESFRPALLGLLLIVICLVDMGLENKRYLNDDSFSDPMQRSQVFEQKSAADAVILEDKDLSYRVANLGTDTFSESSNQTSYWHKSIGGYHAAKLHRYQDVIDRYLKKQLQAFSSSVNTKQEEVLADSIGLIKAGITSQQELFGYIMSKVDGDSLFNVLNMLNMKYAIMGNGKFAIPNPYANGNGWFVSDLKYVDTPDAEIAGLRDLDTKHAAVADKKFESALSGTALGEGTVQMTSYAPNELHYTVETAKGGVCVFSEVYYPGWTATVDGKEVAVGRVNYILRAIKVGAGKHDVVLEFRPTTVKATDAIAWASLCVILLGFLWLLVKPCVKKD